MKHSHSHTHEADEKRPTLVAYVMDASGSMRRVASATISGYNEYLNTLKDDKENEYFFGRTIFNSSRTDIQDPLPIEFVEELDTKTYIPNFQTPLVDATYDTIIRAEKEARKLHDPRVLIVIQTDGLENASHRSTADLNALIQKMTKKSWEFLFLGADQDAWAQAQEFGIKQDWAVSYDNDPAQVQQVFHATAVSNTAYAAAGAGAASDSLDLNIGKKRDIRKKANR